MKTEIKTVEDVQNLYVARRKGGHVLHLRHLSHDALCGIGDDPDRRSYRMKQRQGWQTYKQESSRRASCVHCIAKVDEFNKENNT